MKISYRKENYVRPLSSLESDCVKWIFLEFYISNLHFQISHYEVIYISHFKTLILMYFSETYFSLMDLAYLLRFLSILITFMLLFYFITLLNISNVFCYFYYSLSSPSSLYVRIFDQDLFLEIHIRPKLCLLINRP